MLLSCLLDDACCLLHACFAHDTPLFRQEPRRENGGALSGTPPVYQYIKMPMFRLSAWFDRHILHDLIAIGEGAAACPVIIGDESSRELGQIGTDGGWRHGHRIFAAQGKHTRVILQTQSVRVATDGTDHHAAI